MLFQSSLKFLLLDFIRIFDFRWGVMEVGSSNWFGFFFPPLQQSFFFFFYSSDGWSFFLSLTGGWIFFFKNYDFITGFWGRISLCQRLDSRKLTQIWAPKVRESAGGERRAQRASRRRRKRFRETNSQFLALNSCNASWISCSFMVYDTD